MTHKEIVTIQRIEAELYYWCKFFELRRAKKESREGMTLRDHFEVPKTNYPPEELRAFAQWVAVYDTMYSLEIPTDHTLNDHMRAKRIYEAIINSFERSEEA